MAHTPHLRLVPEHPGPEFFGVEPALVIDCDTCMVRDRSACDDCLVTHLVGHEQGAPVTLDAREARAVDLLTEAGLVPASRYTPRPGIA